MGWQEEDQKIDNLSGRGVRSNNKINRIISMIGRSIGTQIVASLDGPAFPCDMMIGVGKAYI